LQGESKRQKGGGKKEKEKGKYGNSGRGEGLPDGKLKFCFPGGTRILQGKGREKKTRKEGDRFRTELAFQKKEIRD